MPPPARSNGPKRSNSAAIVAAVLTGAFLLVLGTTGMVALTSANRSSASDYAYSTGDYSTGAPDGSDTTETFANDDHGSTSDRNSTNDEYTTTTAVPSGPQPVYETASNPVATVAMAVPDVPCDLPAWESTPRGAQRYFKAALPCLDQAWRPVMRQADLPFAPPNLAFPSGGSWSSPCGSVSRSQNVAAFYCSSNTTIYMPFRGLQTDQLGNRPAIYLGVFAHEYGHHIQNISGIARAWQQKAYDSGGYDTPRALALSRRSELQAQCFSGQYLASAERTDSITTEAAWNSIRNHYERGDRPGKPRDHGTPEHYGGWMETGYSRNNTAQCNTWAAPASDVS
ncbi:neutral zinc metallopeptidase [Haloactinomyces albus]|uniref:Metalloprotease n=1 Tax=Haloactinomyces albus TaxID=1352928 RepID=A0AAE3ZDH7_9ACTN|nr:neutral zinc metallopeptidase [Haloactinomyces albus]MDR7302897.1 putative metalloprotease [Haloactinomyces albus]